MQPSSLTAGQWTGWVVLTQAADALPGRGRSVGLTTEGYKQIFRQRKALQEHRLAEPDLIVTYDRIPSLDTALALAGLDGDNTDHRLIKSVVLAWPTVWAAIERRSKDKYVVHVCGDREQLVSLLRDALANSPFADLADERLVLNPGESIVVAFDEKGAASFGRVP